MMLLRVAYTVGTVIGQPGCCDIDHYLKYNIRRCGVTTQHFPERGTSTASGTCSPPEPLHLEHHSTSAL
jgi:hypothetical protein